MRVRALACLVAFLCGTACSFTMSDAPERPYQTMPDCETSRVKPVFDILGAGTMLSLALAFALVAAVDDELGGDGSDEAGLVALGSLAAGGAFTFASIGGFRKAGRCRAAQVEFTTMMYYNMQRQAYPYRAPQPQPPQPQPPQPQPPQPQPPQPQPKSTVPVGAERGQCRSDGTCDPGLTCASGRCVFLPR